MFIPTIVRKKPYPWIGGSPPKGVEVTKVIVCGSRTFDDFELMRKKLDRYTYWFDVVEISTGGYGGKEERGGEWHHIGADFYAHQWAEQNWCNRKIFFPDWKKHKKAAGPIRNREMAEYVAPDGYCVAFWDGKSPGTKNMIEEFLKHNPRGNLRTVLYKG
jgi:hypothetical protein